LHHDHHHHLPGTAHPPQPLTWSLLRMAMPLRLAGAGVVAALLWAFVLVAMR
jgi:hypothetical protein